MCKKYKACKHALTPRYVTIVSGQFAGMRARPLGRSNSAWGGVALSGSTVVQTSCCRLPSRKRAAQREWHWSAYYITVSLKMGIA